MLDRPPKVFISYSWTSEEYQNRVIEFATRLGDVLWKIFCWLNPITKINILLLG